MMVFVAMPSTFAYLNKKKIVLQQFYCKKNSFKSNKNSMRTFSENNDKPMPLCKPYASFYLKK